MAAAPVEAKEVVKEATLIRSIDLLVRHRKLAIVIQNFLCHHFLIKKMMDHLLLTCKGGFFIAIESTYLYGAQRNRFHI